MFRLTALFALFIGIAHAEPIKIVAFGGSNTYGKGVATDQAYPAQLERLLRSAGYDVVVKNEGTNGQTTAAELGNLDSAVPNGVKIVIYQPGGNDNRRSSSNTSYNIRAVVQKLLDRHVLVLFSGPPSRRQYVQDLNIMTIDEINRLVPETELQGDKVHLTPNGYKMVAEKMFPLVKDLIGKVPQE